MPMMNPAMMGPMGMGMQQDDGSSEKEVERAVRRRPAPAASSAAPPGPVTEAPTSQAEGTLRLQEPISRAHGFVASLGIDRLSQQLELLNPLFDSTMTCDMSKEGLLIMIWIVTRVKPNMTTSSLPLVIYLYGW